MALFYLYLLGTAVVAWLLQRFISLFANYRIARGIGYPIIISPVHMMDLVWVIAWKAFTVRRISQYLPGGLGRWARCTYPGWAFHDRYALSQELGKVVVLVTPKGNSVIVADHKAFFMISRRKEYIKPRDMYKGLEFFGPNVITAEGEDWQRHRRITAPTFNEKTSSLVWKEARRQAMDMLLAWIEMGSAGTKNTVEDTTKLAMHVLTSAGFGIFYSFRGDAQLPSGHTMAFGDALSLIIRNFAYVMMFSSKQLTSPIMPRKLQKIGQAIKEFKRYSREMLENERERISNHKPGESNLMTVLARANIQDAHHTALRLSDDEAYGNIFIYALGGHETTASALSYALVLLAANPECQDWLVEEINQVFGNNNESSKEPTYEELFPQLKRCLAVMHETLRLYWPVSDLPKSTGSNPETLTTDGRDHIIPPRTVISINIYAIHTDPDLWGSDSLIWRPQRWLTPTDSDADSVTVGKEMLMERPGGMFAPWSEGPRNCPGQKFSQVEFVAVTALLFRNHRVRPVLREGQSVEDGKKELMRMANDSAIDFMMRMRNPKRVSLKWVRKDDE